MSGEPAYFEAIRASANRRWVQLEDDPDLAGPWHRLFQQVQSPRHVVSELLQNADDAGATSASVTLEDDEFIFCHNGRDFTADEFQSICRFGYSNKRALHTIGFRGVGFKSVFSLGDTVYINTPTLHVSFEKTRFTEPVWTPGPDVASGSTRISTRLRDAGVAKELRKNLDDWLASPASLLFFRHVRSLRIGDTELRWTEVEPGPVPNSVWLQSVEADGETCLLIRSEPEPFPAEALAEIEAERILGEGEHLDLPPCALEILLGSDARLFVVLPTGVRTMLPFAINAPFVQDTARLKIKDPDSSPTNRWLLERAGRLAAHAMLSWLRASDRSVGDRASSYNLMPDVDRDDASLEGSCAAAVEIAFDTAVEGEQYVLVEPHGLAEAGEVIETPAALVEVWPAAELARLFGSDGDSILSRDIADDNCEKLRNWQAARLVTRDQVLTGLRGSQPSKPSSWRKLLTLWSYLSDDISAYHWQRRNLRDLNIVPVQAGDRLESAETVVRLGEKKLLVSDGDWNFLSGYLRVFNPNWVRFLAEQRKLAETRSDSQSTAEIERAYRTLGNLRLEEPSEVSVVLQRVATDFFSHGSRVISECTRLAQIAAHLGASVGGDFRYVTQDDRLTNGSYGVVADERGSISALVPAKWYADHVLHDSYWTDFSSCTRDEWRAWIGSGRSGLLSAPPLDSVSQQLWSRRQLDRELQARGFDGQYEPFYKTENFVVDDFDFDDDLWAHWRGESAHDVGLWASLVDLILTQRASFWNSSLEAKVAHIATTGNRRQIASGLSASWILKLRDLPCLRDTRGFLRKPREVFRRTRATEALLDVEPFVPADIDTEANRPLFDALGVCRVPTGPRQIMERIRALAEAEEPPLAELDKWYCRLDSLLSSCSTDDVNDVRLSFQNEELIYSESHGWVTSSEVFLSASEEDIPDAPLVRASVRDLALWHRLNVAERPNFERILEWLGSLPPSSPLPTDLAKRVRSALARFPESVWIGCAHWLNLTSEWVPVADLRYSVSMRSLTKTQDLFPAVKQKTADFQMLNAESLDRRPFSDLSSLASCIDERLNDDRIWEFEEVEKPWIRTFGATLARIERASADEQRIFRSAAARLAETCWRQGDGLETIPYIDGVPVGPPRRVSAVWTGNTLYVEDGPITALAAPIAREIGRAFDNVAITDAIKFCFERDAQFIVGYLEQEFDLQAERAVQPELSEPPKEPVEFPGERELYPSSESPRQSGETVTAAEQPRIDEEPEEPEFIPQPTSQPERRRESPSPPRPHRLTLIEQFAAQRGFSLNGDGTLRSADGRRLIRSDSAVFPWEMRSQAGDLIQALLPFEHCLDQEPITVDAEAWAMLQASGETYALLLRAPDHTPQILTGSQIGRDLATGRVVLFPARYRIARDAR